jgi:phage-related minor tail protein
MADDVDKLRQPAAWYREFADRAGYPWVWDTRLRTAQELEAKAGQRGRRAMKSAEELRAESRRLREAVKTLSDPQLKKELAARALDLAHRAEAIANSMKNPEIIMINIARYRSMLAAGISSESHKKIIEEMLADAETLLTTLSKKSP